MGLLIIGGEVVTRLCAGSRAQLLDRKNPSFGRLLAGGGSCWDFVYRKDRKGRYQAGRYLSYQGDLFEMKSNLRAAE